MDVTFEYEDETVKARIVCHSADNRTGIKRQIMISDARDEEDKEKEKDSVRFIEHTFQWPLLMAASEFQLFQLNGEDKALDFPLFETLPSVFTWMWEQKVYEANPHWRFGQTVESIEELQKKVRKPTSGLEDSTKPNSKAKK
jgi:hypothetical protein